MKFEFADPNLEEVYYNPKVSIGISPAVDKGFRKAIGYIDSAVDELDLRRYKGLHYHKLERERRHQHGIDLTDQWRLIVERVKNKGEISLLIIEVTDYH